MGKCFGSLHAVTMLSLTAALFLPNAAAHEPSLAKGSGPEISVSPTQLVINLPAGQTTTTTTFRINNTGSAALTWTAPAATAATPLLNQATGLGAQVSTYYLGMSTGSYSAVDFVVPAGSGRLRNILAYGDDPERSLAAQPSITWWIFRDAGGVPGGNPETNPAAAVWRYTAPIGSPGMTIVNEDPRLDLVAAGQNVVLAPGTYWLSVVPNYNNTPPTSTQNGWYWQVSGPLVGAAKKWFSPNLFGGTASWQDLAVGTSNELATHITAETPCPASWVQLLTTAGTVSAGGNATITVSVNAAALGPGTHQTTICIQSNDADTPSVQIPVRLVGEAIMFRNGFETGQQSLP